MVTVVVLEAVPPVEVVESSVADVEGATELDGSTDPPPDVSVDAGPVEVASVDAVDAVVGAVVGAAVTGGGATGGAGSSSRSSNPAITTAAPAPTTRAATARRRPCVNQCSFGGGGPSSATHAAGVPGGGVVAGPVSGRGNVAPSGASAGCWGSVMPRRAYRTAAAAEPRDGAG